MFWCKKRILSAKSVDPKFKVVPFKTEVLVRKYQVTVFVKGKKKFVKTVTANYEFTTNYVNLATGKTGAYNSQLSDPNTVKFTEAVWTGCLNPYDYTCNGSVLAFQTDDGATEIIPISEYVRTHISPVLEEKLVEVAIDKIVPIGE